MQDDKLSKSKARMSSLRSPIRQQTELSLLCYSPVPPRHPQPWAEIPQLAIRQLISIS